MGIRVAWQASTDPLIASYDLERAPVIVGPWSLLANVLHTIPGANWDASNNVFFYNDPAGTESTYYRLTAIDSEGLRSQVSNPFRAPGPTGIPSLVNTISIPVGDVAALLHLEFTTLEVWASDDESATWTELTSDDRLVLADGVTFYTYYDVVGGSGRRYRWRFSNNGQAPFSRFSQYQSGQPLPLAGIQTSVAMARFIDAAGRPQRRTVIMVIEETQVVSGFTIGDHDPLMVTSDDDGFWQAPLVQGARVRVAIEGTSTVKTITVPKTPTFDLVTALSDIPDQFTVQTTPPLLTKRHV